MVRHSTILDVKPRGFDLEKHQESVDRISNSVHSHGEHKVATRAASQPCFQQMTCSFNIGHGLPKLQVTFWL